MPVSDNPEFRIKNLLFMIESKWRQIVPRYANFLVMEDLTDPFLEAECVCKVCGTFFGYSLIGEEVLNRLNFLI